MDYLGIYIELRLDDFEDFWIDTCLKICLYFAKMDHISMILDPHNIRMIATVIFIGATPRADTDVEK